MRKRTPLLGDMSDDAVGAFVRLRVRFWQLDNVQIQGESCGLRAIGFDEEQVISRLIDQAFAARQQATASTSGDKS